jgi:phospholipid/cholesterol/gamma-HCH transport system ATP-binding protein
MSEKALIPVRRRIGFLFQSGALFDSMTVERNICFPMAEHGEGDDDQRRQRCREVLEMVGLDGLQARFPEELSGGQQKRVALARAIVLNPELVLYDEPTTGLDPVRADLINELILRLQEKLGVTSIVVTHDLASARKVADRVLMLHEGRFITDTTPQTMDDVENDVFRHFVEGRASDEELEQIAGSSQKG